MPHDAGSCLKRVNAVLGLYFDPDFDQETKALVRNEFVRALSNMPDWAVQRAFDVWAKTMQRRPSPGEIVILAEREIKPLTDEIARRRALIAPPQTERQPVDAAEAERIMQSNGYTAKRMDDLRKAPMANTWAEAEATAHRPRVPHWSENADPDGPAMQQLRASRAANPLVRAALASQAAQQAKAGAV